MDLNRGLEYRPSRAQSSSSVPDHLRRLHPPSMFVHPSTQHYSRHATSSSFVIFSPTAVVAQQSVAYVRGQNVRTPSPSPVTRPNAYVRGMGVDFDEVWEDVPPSPFPVLYAYFYVRRSELWRSRL